MIPRNIGEPIERWQDIALAIGWCPEKPEDVRDDIENRCDIIAEAAAQAGMEIDAVQYNKLSGMSVRLIGKNMLVGHEQAQAMIVRRLYEAGYYMRLSLGAKRGERAEMLYCVAKRQNINQALWKHRPGKGHPDYVTPAKALRLGLD